MYLRFLNASLSIGFLLAIIFTGLTSCKEKPENAIAEEAMVATDARFTLVPSQETGVNFMNKMASI